MNVVTFPLLEIKLNINQIAFRVFGIPIYWYAILIVGGFILALYFCKKKDGTFGIHYEDIIDLSIILIPIAFICARLYYIVFNLQNYTSFSKMLNLKDGGLAIYGGILGGAIVIILFCKKRKLQVLDLMDYLVPYLALGQSIGRWGNFFNVEAYGRITNLPWKMGIMQGNNMIYVHPTFLYESIATFCIFILLSKLSKNRKFKGQMTYIYLISYSFVRFFIEGLRTDSLMIGNLRVSQVLSAIIFIVLGILFVKKIIKKEKNVM